MKHNFKKVMSLLFILAMMLTFVPVQKISADDIASSQSTFTLLLKGDLKYKLGENADFQDYTDEIDAPYNQKITLKAEIESDKEASWQSVIMGDVNGTNTIKVYEGEETTGQAKMIYDVKSPTITFSVTEDMLKDGSSKNGKKQLTMELRKNQKKKETFRFVGSGIANDTFIIKEMKEVNLTDFLTYKTQSINNQKSQFSDFVWASENKEVLEIDASQGIFTPKAFGTSKVSVSAKYNGTTDITGEINVNVDGFLFTQLASDKTKNAVEPKKYFKDQIVKVEYQAEDKKELIGWDLLQSQNKNIDADGIDTVTQNGDSTGSNSKDISDPIFYFKMPEKDIIFAPRVENAVTLTKLDGAGAKLISRKGKKLPQAKELQEGARLIQGDELEITPTDIKNFNQWTLEGLQTTNAGNPVSATVKGDMDVAIIASYRPYASTVATIISGEVGKPLTHTITIRLKHAFFRKDVINQGIDVKPWFSKQLDSLSYTAKNKVAEHADFIEILISGTPTTASTSVENDNLTRITIPKQLLEDKDKKVIDQELDVDPNDKIQYKIEKKSHKPKQENPNQNFNPKTGSESNTNSGSGTSSKVEKITDKNKTQKPKPEDDKKLQEKKTEEKKPQTSEKLKETMTDQKVIKVGDVEIQKVFEDVKQDDWFATSVAFVKEMNLINGTQEMKFSPQEKTTRAMLVTILYRLAGTPMTEEKASFSDVKGDEYFAQAISWASKSGIVKGYETGAFGTNDNITREQLAVILYNYAVNAKKEIANTADIKKFNDIDSISNYAIEAMNWTVSTGIIRGKGNQLDPKANATRAEVATMIMRFAEFLK